MSVLNKLKEKKLFQKYSNLNFVRFLKNFELLAPQVPLLNYFLKSVAKFNNLLAHEKSYAEDSCYLIKTKVQRLAL